MFYLFNKLHENLFELFCSQTSRQALAEVTRYQKQRLDSSLTPAGLHKHWYSNCSYLHNCTAFCGQFPAGEIQSVGDQ